MNFWRNRSDILGFDDRLFRLIGIPLLGFLVPLLFFGAGLQDGLVAYLPKWLEATIFTIAFWEGSRFILIQMRRRFPREAQVRWRIAVQTMLITVYAIGVNFGLGYLLSEVIVICQYPEVRNTTIMMVSTMTITYLIMGIYEAAYFYRKWINALVDKERFEREAAQSQLEGLRSQVNPHFLFNSLNTLVYMIKGDPDGAVSFVQRMSKVYRYILEIRDRELISLQEELDFLDNYLFLLKQRFEDNLQVSIELPANATDYQILPLSLQMLFENAIKHNVISTRQPLHIRVWVENQKLIVKNNLQPKSQAEPSTRVGLDNIRHRYAFLTREEVEVLTTQQSFIVAIPLLSVKAPALKIEA
ncbi:MAG: histidine kinase [Saprospiraceae bacterium]|nr:histidine kinase [Saprospiraceae bacterium]